MASNPNPVRVTISHPADGADGLKPASVIVSGSTNIDYAVSRKAVARDVFGREFPGSVRQPPDSGDWTATFADLPTEKWLVVYIEFQRPGHDDIGASVISIRCSDRTQAPQVPSIPARQKARAKAKPSRKPVRTSPKKSKKRKK